MHTSCRHCPYCALCFADYRMYIEHFRVGGRLVFTSCPMKEE
jgi:hypothetical protein